jgi:uncharacterized protein YprB with RNaseH-like and TPR domain
MGSDVHLLGFRSKVTGLVQLVGKEITTVWLRRELPRCGRLYRFNGHSFDLPCIRAQTGVDLRAMFDSRDLMWICRRAGFDGGQKHIEKRLGFERRLHGLCGRDAIRLWRRSCGGDHAARRTLLDYKAEDLDGLAFIRRQLHSHLT